MENKMDPGDVPVELQELTIVEEMLIAQVRNKLTNYQHIT